MIKKYKSVIEWWDSLGTKPANPAVVWWVLGAWLILSAVVLFRCG